MRVKRTFQFTAWAYNFACLHFYRFMYGLVFLRKVRQTFAFSRIASVVYQNILSRFLLSFVHRKYPTGHRFMFAFWRTLFSFVFWSIPILYPFDIRSISVLYPFRSCSHTRSVSIPFPFMFAFPVRFLLISTVEDEDFCILFGLLFWFLNNIKIHKTKAVKNIWQRKIYYLVDF